MEILGIDIGGSGIKGAIVDTKTGELLTERHRIPTPEGRKPGDVATTVKAIVDHFNWKGKVGCGLPTAIHHGKALYKSNLHKSWVGVQVDELFEEATGLDFTVVNDADAAAMAAMHFGVGKGEMGFVCGLSFHLPSSYRSIPFNRSSTPVASLNHQAAGSEDTTERRVRDLRTPTND